MTGVIESPKKSVESYKHRYAKQVLVEWLRNAARQGGRYAKFAHLHWRVGRGEPTLGVYEEYPISVSVLSNDAIQAWDEIHPYWKVPTYEEMIEEGEKPLAILDVAILRRGVIVYGFEIVHKHDISECKADFLNTLNLDVWTIDAEWILRQVGVPEKLKTKAKYGRVY